MCCFHLYLLRMERAAAVRERSSSSRGSGTSSSRAQLLSRGRSSSRVRAAKQPGGGQLGRVVQELQCHKPERPSSLVMNQQQEKMIQGLQELGKVPAERRQQLLVGAGAEGGQLQLSTRCL
jgi:hypothetical protein